VGSCPSHWAERQALHKVGARTASTSLQVVLPTSESTYFALIQLVG